MTLTPEHFCADLTQRDLANLRHEMHLERVRDARLLECSVRRSADPGLRRGDIIWVDDVKNRVRGRFVVLNIRVSVGHTFYRLAANGQRPPRRWEELIPLQIE